MNDEASSTGAKLQDFYSSLGIETRDSEGQLRNFYDVLSEMGGKWDTLTADQKKYYALIQAGANQSQNLLAVMENWDDAKKATQTAINSQGSAMQENEKVLDSVEGKINKLKSALQKLSHDFMSSDLLKGGLDVVTKLIEGLDKLISAGNGLAKFPALIGAIVGGFRIFGGVLAGTGHQFDGLTKIIDGMMKLLLGKRGFDVFTNGAKTMGEALGDAGKAGKIAGEEIKDAVEDASVETVSLGTKISTTFKNAGEWISKNKVLLTELGVAAGVLIAIFGAIKIDKYFGVEESLKRMHEYEGQLDDVKGKIEELEKKRANGTITRAEQSQLRHLKLEERTLLRLIELENKRAKKSAIKNLERGSGKQHGEKAGTEKSATYDEAEAKYREQKKKIDDLQRQYDGLDRKRMTGDSWSKNDEDALNALDRELQKEEAKLDKYKGEMAEAGEALAEEFDNGFETGMRKAGMSDKQKANYDAQRKSFIRSMLDPDAVEEDFDKVADMANTMFDKLEGEVNAHDVDLLDAKNSLDVIKKIRKEAKAGAKMSFDIKDKEGNSIKQIEGKLKDFTDEDLKILIDAEMTGDLSALESYEGNNESILNIKAQLNDKDAKKAESDLTSDKEVKVKAKSDKTSFNKVENDEKNLTGTGEWTLKIKTTGYEDAKKKAEDIKKKIPTGGSQYHFFATGKRKGQKGGLAWLGDQATSSSSPRPELVVTKDGAYLAGTTGWELHEISDQDTVYSYAETKRLLGRNPKNSGGFMMPRYAKGKKSTKQKKREEFDRKLEALEYKRDIYHWSDKTFRDKYNALRKKYKKWLSVDQKRDYGRTNAEYLHDSASDTATRYTEAVSENGDAKKALDYITKIRKAKKISAKEAKELRAEVYKNELDYYAREYSKGKKSYEDMYKVAKNYWAKVGKDTKEYYESLDVLRQAEQERLEKKQETYSDELEYGKAYVDYEIKQLEKQKEIVEKQKEQKEDAEKLVDLQNELSKARSTMVRTYKEGVGWVYEADAKAIRDAQKNLDDYMDEHKTDSIQSQIDMWQEIADLFDDIAEQSELFALAQKLGVNNLYDLVKGDITDVEQWLIGLKAIILG